MKFLKKVLTNNEPTIIYFHYNLKGPFSNWFPEESKEIFFEFIKNYNNIKYICVGHRHDSYVEHYEGFTILSGAGNYSILLTLSDDPNDIDLIELV
jgi:hypothetical protein